MLNTESTSFDIEHLAELRQKVCERNASFREREIAGTHERTHRSKDYSSVFLWINHEPGNFPLHWHSTVEIIMPLQNGYTVTINKNEYLLKENEILIIPPGELHELTPPPGGYRLVLLFDLSGLTKFKGFTRLFSRPSISAPITPETMPDIYEKVRALLVQIAEEYANGDDLAEPSILAMLIQFFVLLARNSDDTIPASLPAMQPNKQREYIEKFNIVFDYIEHHYMEDITLEEVAAQIGFSKFHFSRLFRQFTDTAFYDYLCARRIKAAETLLLDPNLPITEIALQSGFASISTFNRVFKKFKECTPTEFKEFNKENRRVTQTRDKQQK
ncbi:MAG: helix-turn-helix transcriptional regulator [Lachnospiraceae bacterium]|nr:helix-turn-helix transcriptional regulator [Lachnospiraceae bacterium]